jgi:chemotaxis protein CheX
MVFDAGSKPRLEELEQVVGSVFSTMMGLETERHPDDPEGLPGTGLITSAVFLAGEWKGAVLVHCPPSQACCFAGFFRGQPGYELINDDVRDVMGELANMIAGNLKCALRPGTRLSVPWVIDGAGYGVRWSGGRMVHRSKFMTPQGPFWVTILDATGSPTPGASSRESR